MLVCNPSSTHVYIRISNLMSLGLNLNLVHLVKFCVYSQLSNLNHSPILTRRENTSKFSL